MPITFTGGPHDGLALSQTELNRIGQAPTALAVGEASRFVLLPQSVDELHRLLRGEPQAVGALTVLVAYERMPDGNFREATVAYELAVTTGPLAKLIGGKE